MSDVLARFHDAWTRVETLDTTAAELLPVRLARACASVLGVDGAGLSLITRDYRVPLGGSDEAAGRAERLQFTLGEGPCLQAARTGLAVSADSRQVQRRWPQYARELFDHTPYRAVVSLPLRPPAGPATLGALDLFLTEPTRLDALSLTDAAIVADEVLVALGLAARLGAATGLRPDQPELAPLLGPGTRARTSVWIATGIVMSRFDLGASDALALLRAYAYARDTTVDDIAAAALSGALDVAGLQP